MGSTIQLLMRARTRRQKARKSPKKRTHNPKTSKHAEKSKEKRKKICHCIEGFGKLLAKSTHRTHYRTVNNMPWKDSESEDGDSGNSESDGSDSAEMDVDNSDNNLFQSPANVRQQSYTVDPPDVGANMDTEDSSDSSSDPDDVSGDFDDLSSTNSDSISGISDFIWMVLAQRSAWTRKNGQILMKKWTTSFPLLAKR
ncbi:hypothetical protein B0H16DRAFT_1476414 [Mycena metata]|uniref:Uncharacterized protein n=1 Tax=Mycena metata TaxID=1033252 RepID=A0AAD7HBG0_9AGAR|nr:hypothetical protein B0H16DRAFT_1476414 [Mycena metata]